MSAAPQKQVQCFGRKRNAVAVALARQGKGHIRLNGQPLTLVEPSIMRIKAMEPLLLLKREHYAHIDVRMRVKGGGQSAQVYAVRQALAKAIVAFAQKCALGRACVLVCVCVRRPRRPLFSPPSPPRLPFSQ
jgi:small subunit ribosomal protein S16e